MITRIYRKCDFLPGESLASFVSRFALHNGFRSADELCKSIGIHFLYIADTDPYLLGKISKLTGVHASILWPASFRYEDGHLHLGHELIRRRSLRFDHIYACPACLRDDRKTARSGGEPTMYGRTEWLLSVFRSCPHHCIALVPIADMPRRDSTDPQDFSRLLRRVKPPLRKLLSQARIRWPSRLEGYVRKRLDGTGDGAGFLDRMDLHAAIETCQRLGLLINVGPDAATWLTSEKDWHRAGDVGYQFAGHGIRGFRSAFREIREKWSPGDDDPDWPRTTFGFFYGWLADLRDEPSLDVTRDEFRRYLLDTMQVGPAGSTIGRSMLDILGPILTSANQNARSNSQERKFVEIGGMMLEIEDEDLEESDVE